MLENTPEHKCENDNETGFTEPPDMSFDWLSSTASDGPAGLSKENLFHFVAK